MKKIFISYKRKDKETVSRIVGFIEGKLNLECWIDLNGIDYGQQFKSVICNAIDNSDVVLFMYSQEHLHIDFQNDWTIKELNYAQQKGKQVILVKIDDSPLDNVFLMDYGTKNNVNSEDPIQMKKLLEFLSDDIVTDDIVTPVTPSEEAERCYNEGLKWFNDNGITLWKEASLYFKKASKNGGHGDAELKLGFIYQNGGHGIERNYAEAAKWYRLALTHGEKEARSKLFILERQGY